MFAQKRSRAGSRRLLPSAVYACKRGLWDIAALERLREEEADFNENYFQNVHPHRSDETITRHALAQNSRFLGMILVEIGQVSPATALAPSYPDFCIFSSLPYCATVGCYTCRKQDDFNPKHL